jgi:hypothetical protein
MMDTLGVIKRGVFAAERGLDVLADMWAVALMEGWQDRRKFSTIGYSAKADLVRFSHIGFRRQGETLIRPCENFQPHKLKFSGKALYEVDQRPPIPMSDEELVLITAQMWIDLWVYFGSEGGMGGAAASLLRQKNLYAARDSFQEMEKVVAAHPELTVRRYNLLDEGRVVETKRMSHPEYLEALDKAVEEGGWDRTWVQVDDWEGVFHVNLY